jgi:hypothetical protein
MSSDPGLLDRVLRPRDVAEHPVGQRQQGGAVHLESLGVVGHGDETESAVEV